MGYSSKRSKVALSKLTFHRLTWLEWVAVALSAAYFYFSGPLLFTAVLAMPLLGVLLNGLTGRPSIASLVEITTDKDGNDKYDVADFIDVPAWIIALRVWIDFDVYDLPSLFIPGMVAVAAIALLLLLTHKLIRESQRSLNWIYGSLVINLLIYSFAGTYGANYMYDTSVPQVYPTTVLNKTFERGRKGNTSFYVHIAPWGNHPDREKIRVSNNDFNKIQEGQTIHIELKKGFLNIPWYYIKDRQAPSFWGRYWN